MTVLRALAAAWLADRPHGAVDARLRAAARRPRRGARGHRPRPRPARQARTTTASPPCSACPTPTTLLTGVSPPPAPSPTPLDGTVRRAAQAQRARTLRVGPRRPQLTPLGYGLFEHDGEVVLGPARRAGRRPAARAAGRAGRRPAQPAARRRPRSQTWRRSAPPLPTPWPPAALAACSATCWPPGPAWSRCGRGWTSPGVVEYVDPGVGRRAQPAAAQRRSTGTPSTGT